MKKALNRHKNVLAPGIAEDLTADPFFAYPGNVGYRSGAGYAIALFVRTGANTFDAHLLCEPPWRGTMAVLFGRKAVEQVFTDEEAYFITATIPRDNRPSRIVCRAIGGIPFDETTDPFGRPCIVYKMERPRWEAFSAASPA